MNILKILPGLLFITMVAANFDDSNKPLCERCTCRGTRIHCRDIRYFPSTFPKQTTELNFVTMNIGTLPSNAFAGLDNLEQLSFNRSAIGHIESCTFSGLPSLTSLKFDSVVVKSIEKFAFSQMGGKADIDVFKCNITHVMPYAFSSMASVSSLSIRNTTVFNFHDSSLFNITNLEKGLHFHGNDLRHVFINAFQNVHDIGRVMWKENVIQLIGCGSVENFMSEKNKFSFEDNLVTCDCKLHWVKEKYSIFATNRFTNFSTTACLGEKRTSIVEVLQSLNRCNSETENAKTKCTPYDVVAVNPKCALRQAANSHVHDNSDDDDDDDDGNGALPTTHISLGTIAFIVLITLVG